MINVSYITVLSTSLLLFGCQKLRLVQGLRQLAQDGVEKNENYCMRSTDQRRFRNSNEKLICQTIKFFWSLNWKASSLNILFCYERIVNLENYESWKILILISMASKSWSLIFSFLVQFCFRVLNSLLQSLEFFSKVWNKHLSSLIRSSAVI